MQVIQPLHTALLISDLAQAEHFYGTILGLEKVERVLKFPGLWYQVGTYQIHLILQPHVSHSFTDPNKWGRNQHLAFAVADLNAAQAQLLAHQCPIQKSASGRAALFTQDFDGNVIELSQVDIN